jgi:hypothetical protein
MLKAQRLKPKAVHIKIKYNYLELRQLKKEKLFVNNNKYNSFALPKKNKVGCRNS